MNILLTSIGRRDYLVAYFKEALGNQGKLYVSNSVKSLAFESADGAVVTPLIYDSEYIPFIIAYCKSNNINAVMSVFDIDLLILAKNRDAFEKENIQLILAPYEFVAICNDKWETYKFLKSNAISTPLSFISIEETINAIEDNLLQYPVVIKPRWGMGSIGIYTAEDEQELRVLTRKCLRDIESTHLKYESSITPDNSIIFQEKLVGQEYGLDVITDLEGNYIDTFAKKKITMRSGETDLGQTVSNRPFIDVAKAIAQKSKHQAILSVDVFDTSKGVFVLEMNCRISGHYPLSHLAGVNLPAQIVKWLNKGEVDRTLLQFKENIYVVKALHPIILKQ